MWRHRRAFSPDELDVRPAAARAGRARRARVRAARADAAPPRDAGAASGGCCCSRSGSPCSSSPSPRRSPRSASSELFSFHMLQHVLIGDLAPLCLLAGLTGPMLRPVLALRPVERLRVLANPVVALPIWAANLYLWHLPFLYEARVQHSAVHALEHICFFTGGVIMWLPVLETLPAPEWFGTGPKLGYIAAVRLVETVLGNVFVWSGTVFYGVYARGDGALGDLAAPGPGARRRGDDDRGLDRHARRARVALPAARARGRAAAAAARARARPARGPARRPLRPRAGARRPALNSVASMRSSGVHHVDLVVSSIERSLPFYRDLLGPLGCHRIGEVEGERGETIWYFAGPGSSVGLRQAQSRGGTRPLPGRPPPRRARGALTRGRRRARRLARRRRARRSRARRGSTATSPATTRSSSTTRTGSSSRSSTCPAWPRRAPRR